MGRFGFFEESGLDDKLIDFSLEYLVDDEIDTTKFVQVNIKGEDYLRVGNFFHRRIFRDTLEELGLEYSTKFNKIGLEIPLSQGDNYSLVGAGKVIFSEGNLKFYDGSSDYRKDVQGTNKENLESVFGKENVIENGKYFGLPCFLVNFE